MASLDDLLEGVSGIEIGAAQQVVRKQSYTIDNLLAGFTAIAAIAAAGGIGTATMQPSRDIKPKHLVFDVAAQIGAVALTTFTVGPIEQLVGSGPVPASALRADQTFVITGNTINTTPGASITIVNNTAATALANVNNCVVGPAAVAQG